MKKSISTSIYLFGLIVVLLASCKKEDKVVTPSGLRSDPTAALPGAFITIYGTNIQDIVSIKFGNVDAAFSPIYNTKDNIFTTVPTNALYGKQKITIVNRGGQTASLDFTVKQPFPIINSFTPESGPVGDIITISGNYFRNIKSIAIGGTIVTDVTDSTLVNRLSFKIPTGASSGLLTVVTAGGSVSSANLLSVGERAVLIADFDGGGIRPNGTSWYTAGDIDSRTIVNANPAPFTGNFLKLVPKTASTAGYAGIQNYDLSSGSQSFGITSTAATTFLKFEVNNNGKTGTVLQVVVADGTNNFAKNVNVNGTGWTTVSLKLTDLLSGYGSGTLTPTPNTITTVKFFFQGYATAAMEANIDNVRFAY